MLESLRGFPSCLPSALKLASTSVLFIECAIIVGVGLLIARGIARVLLKAYHVRTYRRPQHYVSALRCRDKKWLLNEHSCSASGPEQRKGPLDFLKPTLKHKLEFSRKIRVIFAHLCLFWPCSWLQMINLMEPTLFRLSRPI